MIGNLYPFFTAPNEGCFYWGWIIDIDMQLALLTPLFVFVYLKNRWFGHAFVFITLVGDCALGCWTVYKYNIKAGILAE
jgi:hypothetical protein